MRIFEFLRQKLEIYVYNGRQFIHIPLSENMRYYNLGNFIITRKKHFYRSTKRKKKNTKK